jgi:hypothetical protein
MKEKNMVDLEDLRAEYESTYLAYVGIENSDDFMTFEEWVEKYKGIILK